ncbi:hypothetical protein GQ44DRAFT_283458 [Phaeosphaeriaceae sp. PMI808]|nr:hypothetical protein GQ44DRAFT_283458 [Phaeosphaeriaceae sp. PMI808]
MMNDATQANFFSLPTELRLQIAAYALEQEANIGMLRWQGNRLDNTYSASEQLSLLLVCRRFQRDFTNLAYQMTTFVFVNKALPVIGDQLNERLKYLRKLTIRCYGSWLPLRDWGNYPFDNAAIHLDELCIVSEHPSYTALAILMRRLRNVKILRVLPETGDLGLLYGQLVGAMYKHDHHRRYDAEDAPDLGFTWWKPNLNHKDNTMDFLAQEPGILVAEEEYLAMMKPKIDDLMEWMSHLSIGTS